MTDRTQAYDRVIETYKEEGREFSDQQRKFLWDFLLRVDKEREKPSAPRKYDLSYKGPDIPKASERLCNAHVVKWHTTQLKEALR